MTDVGTVEVACPLCGDPIVVPVAARLLPHVVGAQEVTVRLAVDPRPLRAHTCPPSGGGPGLRVVSA